MVTMEMNSIVEKIENELTRVQSELKIELGSSTICSLEKSKKETHTMKYLEGQQQGLHGALKILLVRQDTKDLLRYLDSEKINTEKMLGSPVGKSANWQEYLWGVLEALDAIYEMLE
jgi:hypothetical protein